MYRKMMDRNVWRRERGRGERERGERGGGGGGETERREREGGEGSSACVVTIFFINTVFFTSALFSLKYTLT